MSLTEMIKSTSPRANGKSVIMENPIEPFKELLLSYKPNPKKHILEFAGTNSLSIGNILTIVGPAGFGKSSVTESVISSCLNHYVDCLGFRASFDNDGLQPILWLDGERTHDDIANGFNRIKKRIMIENNPELIDGDRFKNVHCYPLITHPRREERIKEFERLVHLHKPKLVILDGAADFVKDVNNNDECVDFVSLLIALANQHQFGVIVSIHPNPGGSNDFKPRGVLGSELIRVSESMILLKRAPDDRETRILTMDFSHGKNRNQSDNLSSAFKWNNEEGMFTSCHYTASVRTAKSENQEEVFNQILSDKKLSYGSLVDEIIRVQGKSEPTAKRWIKDAITRQLIFNENGMYGLTPF